MLSQSNNTTEKIQVTTTSRGKTIKAYNYQREKYLAVGSVSGATFEKVANILKMVAGEYRPSFTLTAAELETARELGATFLRVINDGITYAISLNDFERYAEPYKNGMYGKQLACSLEYFAKTGHSKKRNAILDNPRRGPGPEYVRPEVQQLPLFNPGIRRDSRGNFGG